MKLFHGSIRKKLVILVLLATAPVFLVLIGTELANRRSAAVQAQKDLAKLLTGFTEVQYRITEATRALLKTIATIPDIRQGDIEKSRIILSTLLDANPIYTNAILVDIKGDVIAAGRGHEKAIHLNFADRKQFKDAIASKKFSSGEFTVGKATKKSIFPFGMPVLDDQGQPKGAIIVGVKLSHYASLYDRTAFQGSTFFGICDVNGIRLFRYPYSEKISVGQPIKEKVYQAVRGANTPGSLTAGASDGLERIIVFEPLRLEQGAPPYMYMFMGCDQALVTARADTILYRMAGAAALSLTLALAIAWFIGGAGIARHLEKLARISRKFSHEQKTPPSGINYDDGEIGDLAKSFDGMVTMLHNREKERAIALEQLRASEERFRELIEGVSAISIQGYDEQRRVTFWNSATEALYGYTRDDAMGRRLEELIIPEPMREEVIRLHAQWLEHGIVIPASELTLQDKSGNPVQVFSSHVLHDTRKGKEMFCIDVDLTPLKKSEAERQILQDKLRQSQKMEALGTLSGGIAHDFNNILSPILGYSEMLLEENTCTDPDAKESLEQIHTSALRARQLVQKILTFSRQEKAQYKSVSVQGIAKEVIPLLNSTLPRHIEIQQDIDPDCPPILADPIQIHQILMNLATNAAHAMSDDRGELIIILKKSDFPHSDTQKSGGQQRRGICLTVSDTGTGMPPELVERIFDPFFTTKETGKGTGMGLSVVHGIVKQIGGSIEVKSSPGQGTRFDIYFPAISGTTDAPQVPAEKEAPPRGKESILLVDDEPAILHLLQISLERLGYKVHPCSEPLAALEKFQTDPRQFDLVITDMSMPQLSGDELSAKLWQIQKEVKIILCTGFNDKITPEVAQKSGIKKVLLKPLSIKLLSQEVRQVLDTSL